MARQGWGRHTTVVTGDQGSAQVSKNEWNADLNETGMLGFDLETKTLSSDALTPLSTANIVAGEGASADDFSYITYGAGPEVAEEDILFFYKGSQVITVTHNTGSIPSNSGNIQLLGGASKVLNTNLPLILQRKGNVFYEIVSSAGTTVTAGSTTTFTNKSIDLTDNTLTGSSAELATAISDETGSGSLVFATSPTLVTPALGTPSALVGTSITGTAASLTAGNATLAATATALAATRTIAASGDVVWTSAGFDGSGNVTGVAAIGTGVIVNADVKSDAGIDATKLANGTITNTELQYINTLSSNAQTQIDSKSATAGNGSLVTTGALDSGSITSGFGTINNGSSTITTTGALGSGAITTSGTLTMGDNIITGIHSLDMDVDTVAYGASVAIDFTDNEEIILGEITGNLEFTSTTYALGKHKVIHMDSDGSARTFTFPSGWVFYGTKPTATVADKKSILSLSCLGATEALCRAVFVEEA